MKKFAGAENLQQAIEIWGSPRIIPRGWLSPSVLEQ